jgi:hypothetical protein
VNISDWEGVEGRGWVHASSVSWCELSVLLTTVEIPSVYIQPDREVLYVFDHIEVRPLGKDTRGWKLEFYNPTRYEAALSILSEGDEDMKAPLPRHLYRRMPRVHLDAGERKILYF